MALHVLRPRDDAAVGPSPPSEYLQASPRCAAVLVHVLRLFSVRCVPVPFLAQRRCISC